MRILVIEDDKETRDFLATSLKAQSFSVDTAEDGEQGSYLARTTDYDLIILDYILPIKNGRQVCQEIRESGKNTPILMLSGQSEVDHKVDLLNLGADDYLTKPYSLQELSARIQALLRRPAIVQQQILKIADLTLDTVSQKVQRAGKSIYLTRKEFALLEYLLKNAGHTMSPGLIMEHVWDMESDPFSHTLEVHIMNLRKKIDSHGRHKLIHNIAGRGYKVDITK